MKLVCCESRDFVPPVSSWMGSRTPAAVEGCPTCSRASRDPSKNQSSGKDASVTRFENHDWVTICNTIIDNVI